jgi:c-di-GMP-binding flagellar brake protein YcgR
LQNQIQANKQGHPDYSRVRRWPRYKVSLSLRVLIQGPAGAEQMYGHGRDISEGGMAVYVPTDFEIGDMTAIEVTFPNSNEKLSLRAVIRNREGFRYGVEFISLTEKDCALISSNCRALASTQ